MTSDEELTAKYGPVIPEAPVVYGGVQLDEKESLALGLDPKYAVLPKYDIEDVQVGLQTVAVKVRMECRNREQRDGEEWSEEWQMEQTRAKTVFDEETSTLSFARKRVTDMKTCRRVHIPEPREEAINGTPVEVALANINSRGENFARQYIKKNCDKWGNHRNQNLSEEQAEGIKSLKEKVKHKEIYITASDKTGQLVANTMENYVDRMQEHVTNDRVLEWKEKEDKEKHLVTPSKWVAGYKWEKTTIILRGLKVL